MENNTSTARQKEVFMAALEIDDAAERVRFLDGACAGDAALRERVDVLLRMEADAGKFLEPAVLLGESIGYFGDYVLLSEIARGSAGVVFQARQSSLNRVVALKMLRIGPLLTNDDDLVRFRAEAQAAAGLDHPGIVPIYEVGQHEGKGYFSMKLIEGGTLHLRAGEFREPRAAAALIAKVARAVHHAHEHGILHRDLKPGNVLIDRKGEPHVVDFGIARQMGVDSSLTMTGQVIGTPHYMAPEQARGANRELTAAADIYSLGAILYELLAGRRVFASEDFVELLRLVAETPAPPLPASIPRPLAAVVMKCLEKSPAARFGSAGELADDLERFLRGERVLAAKVRRLPWKPVIAAAAVILLAIGANALWQRESGVISVTTLEDELDPPGASGRGVSLREAVRDAAPGGRITFDASVFGKAGKITLDAKKGEIEIEKSLELDASALPDGITLHSAVGGYRKLRIGPAAVVSVKRLSFTAETLSSGPHQGGAINNEGTLTLLDCRFIKNGGGGNGGAVFTSGDLVMERCLFEGNETRNVGGALSIKGPTTTVRATHCLFKGNISHGNGGGGIFVGPNLKEGQVVLDHCTLIGNGATASEYRQHIDVPDRGAGGGIRMEFDSVEITHCLIAGNQSVIPGKENIRGTAKQTGPNFIGGDPKDAPAGIGAVNFADAADFSARPPAPAPTPQSASRAALVNADPAAARRALEWLNRLKTPESRIKVVRPDGQTIDLRLGTPLPDGDFVITELWLDYHGAPADLPQPNPAEFREHAGTLRHLRNCYLRLLELSSADLSFLAHNPELEVLEIEMRGIGDSFIPHIAGLKKLRSLSLQPSRSGPEQLTGRNFDTLACLPDLEVVKFYGSNVGDTAVNILATHCPRLVSLHLDSTLITDAALRSLSRRPLRDLRIGNVSDISDAGLAELSKIPAIRELDLKGSFGITKAAIEAFQKAHPGCHIIR